MKAKEVLKILGITRPTLCHYVKEGRIKVSSKLQKNYYEYDEDSVYSLIGNKIQKNERLIVSYARVSTKIQENQLTEQNKRIYDLCISRGIQLNRQFSDIKSGMSAERNDFLEMMKLVVENKIEMIVLENKDRLVRFGYDILEKIFRLYGTKILILNDSIDNKSYEQELTEDLISVIHYFTMKSYSHRRKLNRLRREIEKNEKEKLEKC